MNVFRRLIKSSVVTVIAALLASSIASCGLFSGDTNDRSVKFELSEDKKSVYFYADADGRAFGDWQVHVEDSSIVSCVSAETESGFLRTSCARTVTGITSGETYVGFYIPSAEQEYTIVIGFIITVDAHLQLSVEQAESDSTLGKE